jgi:oligopeptide transport system substrate-binding protein
MFLLNGPQARAKSGGENAANYQNPEYDRLFEQMKNMPNGPQRQALIDQMLRIAREDAPWPWGFHPKDYGLAHAWVSNVKPNQMARNGLKFYRIDPAMREAKRAEWNRPVLWPIGLAALALGLAAAPALAVYRRRERAPARAA